MEFNGWNSFEDLARACGYTSCNTDSNNTGETSNDNSTNESFNMGCSDIPNGFQSLNPQLFVVIGEILGNMLAGSIPSNVQNSLGNWLELVGQAILTYNAQQQYFEQGPARYFNPRNYNVTNSFFYTTSQNNTPNNSSNKSNCDKVDKLESRINELMVEMEKIKNKMGK